MQPVGPPQRKARYAGLEVKDHIRRVNAKALALLQDLLPVQLLANHHQDIIILILQSNILNKPKFLPLCPTGSNMDRSSISHYINSPIQASHLHAG